MQKFSETLGLLAVQSGTGKPLGRIAGLTVSDSGQEVTGFSVQSKGLLRKKRFVPFCRVRHFGERTVELGFAPSKGKRNAPSLVGQTVRETSGALYGWVTDGLFDENTGHVCAIEVSNGLFEDWTCGRILMRDFILRPEGVVVPTNGAQS